MKEVKSVKSVKGATLWQGIGKRIHVWEMVEGQRIAEESYGRMFFATTVDVPHAYDEDEPGYWSILVLWDGELEPRFIGETRGGAYNMEFYTVEESVSNGQ